MVDAISSVLDIRSEQRFDAADQIIGRATYQANSGLLKNAERWLIAIVQQADALKERTKKDGLFGFTNLFGIKLRSFARAVFKGLDGEPRAQTITEIFAQKEQLSVAAELLRDQVHASKKADYEKSREFYLTDKELSDVSQLQTKLYKEITPDELIKLSSPYDVLFAWSELSSDEQGGPRTLLETALKSDAGLLATLEALRYESSTAQNGVPHVPEGFLKNFVDPKLYKKRLATIAKKNDSHAEHAKRLLELWWEEK